MHIKLNPDSEKTIRSQQRSDTSRPERLTKEQIALLPPFNSLSLSRIHLLKTTVDFDSALREITREKFVGFDTETKPTFTKGGIHDGPHVVQVATIDHAFIVQIDNRPPIDFLKGVIESESIIKVGFGLKSDRVLLRRKLGIRLGASVDLAIVMRKLGYRQAVGVKAAVAIILERQLRKSKSMTTSNWARQNLSPNQLVYAADDALAALKVFYAMGMPYKVSTV